MGGIRYETVPDRKIVDGRDAIVQVSSCVICGSGLHLYDGFMPGMKREAVEVGPRKQGLKVSDRVVVPFTIICGESEQCKRGIELVRAVAHGRMDG